MRVAIGSSLIFLRTMEIACTVSGTAFHYITKDYCNNLQADYIPTLSGPGRVGWKVQPLNQAD